MLMEKDKCFHRFTKYIIHVRMWSKKCEFDCPKVFMGEWIVVPTHTKKAYGNAYLIANYRGSQGRKHILSCINASNELYSSSSVTIPVVFWIVAYLSIDHRFTRLNLHVQIPCWNPSGSSGFGIDSSIA